MGFFDQHRNTVFWVLQILGWGFINSLSLFLVKEVDEFILYSIISGLLVSIGTTSVLRWYLKRNIDFESFKFIDFIKIALSYLMTCVVYGGMNFVLGYLYGKYGPGISEEHIQTFKLHDGLWIQVIGALFIIGAWLVTYLVIKLLLKLNRDRIDRLQLSDSLKQAQLNTLKAQINPHFMFNSLNNIRGLMLEDVERSREMLTKLSEMLRYSLTKNNVNAIALEEELEMVDNYIDLSKIQFENRLQFEKQIGTDTQSVQIPPMIVQLLVENAAKHGISNLKDGGNILLKTTKQGEELHIIVRNTGKLQIAKDSTQLGLKNIRQRLKLLYGDKASFSIVEDEGDVVATIKIPCI